MCLHVPLVESTSPGRTRGTATVAQTDTGESFLRVRAVYERLTHSLFALPALFVLAAAVSAELLIWIDRWTDAPDVLESTVDNARALLATIAGGTITVAAVVFSLTLVAVQLSSSQYSPRTLDTFLGDRFQQVVFGLVLGTFTYSLLVLRVVEAPRDGEPFVPGLSVAFATVLGIASLFAVIASINHTAKSLRVASLTSRITAQTIEIIRRRFGEEVAPAQLQSAGTIPREIDDPLPDHAVVFGSPARGWVQQISGRALLDAVPAGSTVHVVAMVGDYLQRGQPVAYVAPPPSDLDDLLDELEGAMVVGPHRTLQEDVAFGIRLLVDIAVRALSPGVNDPHTAEEVLPRIGAILTELAVRDISSPRVTDGASALVRRRELSHRDYIALGIEPVRRHARSDPQVTAAVLVTLGNVRDEARRRHPAAHVDGVLEQAEILLSELHLMATDADRAIVHRAAEATGFGWDTGPKEPA